MTTRRANLIALVALGLALVLAWGYVGATRVRADGVFTAKSIGQLKAAFRDRAAGQGLGGTDSASPLSSVLYLDSAAAATSPSRDAFGQAWLAFRVVHHIDKLGSLGVEQPPVDSIPGAAEALGVYPGLAQFVADKDGVRTFVKASDAADYLMGEGKSRLALAEGQLRSQFYGTTLNIDNSMFPFDDMPQ